jgi:predicted oxidoreductase
VGGEVVSARIEVDCLCTELADTFVLGLLVAGEGWTKAGEELQGMVSRKFKEPVATKTVISFESLYVVRSGGVGGDLAVRRACAPMRPRIGESGGHVCQGVMGSVDGRAIVV